MFQIVNSTELAALADGVGIEGSLGVIYQLRDTGVCYEWNPTTRVMDRVGGLTVSQAAAVVNGLAIRTEPVQRPYRIASFGDSRASFMSTTTLLAVTGSATYLNANRVAPWLAHFLGDAECVANFGVSGAKVASGTDAWDVSTRSNSKTITNLVSASQFEGGPVDLVYVQYGINDYIAGASGATVSASIKSLCGALIGAGYKVVLEATNPANTTSYSTGPAAKLQATIDGNAILSAWAAGFPNHLVYVDTFSSLVDGTGYASTTYFSDGLHFNQIGAMLSGLACANAARALFPIKTGQVYTSGSKLQPNFIDWGSPTMFTATDFGTLTISTPTWNIDATSGMPYAEVTAAVTALAGGRALFHLEISGSNATGATPRFPVSIGDKMQGSAYVVADDGSGGIAPIQAIMLRQRAYFDSKFADFGAYLGAAGTNYVTGIDGRMTTPTIVMAAASGAIVNTASGGFQLQLYAEFNTVGQTARFRVYAPSLRVVGRGIQPTQPTAGASPYTYTNTTGAPVTLYVAGGTVSAITIARQGTALTTGFTSGAFRLAQNDAVTITYTVIPTLTLVPDESV